MSELPATEPPEQGRGSPRGLRWSLFGYLVAASLVSLLVVLYEADYLVIPFVHSYRALLISFLLLFVGFVGHAMAWHALLSKTEYEASFRDCLAGTGLSVFARYIPGKILVLVGRAAYLSQRLDYPLGKLSLLSLNGQLLGLWTGLAFGGVALVRLGGAPHELAWLMLILWTALGVSVFSDRANAIANRLLARILRREFELPRLDSASAAAVLPWFLGYWLCWSAAFYFLIVALHASDTPWTVGPGFPLATSLGILAFMFPGGIGVREGTLVGLLVSNGFDVVNASSYAVAARLWFLIGEAFAFALGGLADSAIGRRRGE